MALKLRRLLPGVAVGSPADESQAGVKRLARLVQQGAVEELTVRRVRQGAGSLGGGRPGPLLGRPRGRTAAESPPPLVPGGVATAAMRSDMEDLLSKKPFLANPPSKCSLTASFGSQKCMYESIHLLWTTLWIMCKTFGKSQVPLGGRPVFSETFMQNSRKFGWSERTKGKIPCKNDEILTARSQKVTKRIPLCLRSCGK